MDGRLGQRVQAGGQGDAVGVEGVEQAEATGHGPQRAVASGAYGSLIPEGAPRLRASARDRKIFDL